MFVNSDRDCRDKLFELEGSEKFKYCNKKLYIFDENTGMFGDDVHILFRYLTKHQVYLNIIISTDKNGNHKTKNYGTDSVFRKRVISFVKQASIDDDWLKRTAKSSLGYLLFKDGIYNFKTGIFTEGFDPKIVFKCRVPWKFPKYDKDLVKKAYDISFGRLFDDPKPMITALACALAGDIKHKKLYLCPGKTDSGKSYLVRMLEYCFGGYIGFFDGVNLSRQFSNNSMNEAKEFRWAYKNSHRRVLMTNAITMLKPLNGNIIKKLTGENKIIGRMNEESIVPQFTIFCMIDDIPDIKSFDKEVENRLEYSEFSFQFVPKEQVDKKPYYKLKDNNIDLKIKTKDFMKGFVHIFLNAYKDYLENGMPEFDPDVKEKWITESKQNDKVIELVQKYYKITGKDNDRIPICDMKNFWNSHKELKNMSLNRFNEILRDELKLSEGRSASIRFWKGIKKI